MEGDSFMNRANIQAHSYRKYKAYEGGQEGNAKHLGCVWLYNIQI